MKFKDFNTASIRKFTENLLPELFRRKRKHDFWLVWEAIHYLLKTGCAWRELPSYYPPWPTVYFYFKKLYDEGMLEQLNDALVIELRKYAQHPNDPTYVVIDSQTNRTDAFVSQGVGYDAGKKMKGRKRHIAVDSQGFLIALIVHSADLQDRNGFRELLIEVKSKFPSTKIVYADGGYQGAVADEVAQALGFELRVVKRRAEGKGFQVLAKRWVVERTFGWLRFFRRLNRDYEHTVDSANAVLLASSSFLLLNKLAKLI